jgi:glycosyltransferase involved in cell wall biosynthesis
VPVRTRLLLIITLAEAGGAQTYVAELVRGLADRFEITVAAHGPGPLREAVAASGARFIPLRHVRRPLSPVRDVLGLFELYRICRRVRPQIVHANSSKAGVLGCLAAFAARVPIRIFTVHGWGSSWHPGRVYLWGDRLIRRTATRVICVAQSEVERGLEARTCTREQTVVIRNAVDVLAFQTASHEQARPVLVSVGRLQAPKDPLTFVRALARLNGLPFGALMVGGGRERERVAAELREVGLAEHVELLGERRDVRELLARSDVFVLATSSEALPISVLEAMAAGLPVVASAVGGVAELVVDGETGLLVPPGDADALAGALERLLGDGLLRRQMGAAGRSRAEELFDLPSFHRAHLELYARELAVHGLPVPAP